MMCRMKLRNALLPALVLAATVLSACAPVALTAAAGATTTKAAAEERGLGGSARDAGTRIAVNDLWFKHNAEMYRRVGLQIYDGRLLLTGIVPSEDMRDAAVKLAVSPSDTVVAKLDAHLFLASQPIDQAVLGEELDLTVGWKAAKGLGISVGGAVLARPSAELDAWSFVQFDAHL